MCEIQSLYDVLMAVGIFWTNERLLEEPWRLSDDVSPFSVIMRLMKLRNNLEEGCRFTVTSCLQKNE